MSELLLLVLSLSDVITNSNIVSEIIKRKEVDEEKIRRYSILLPLFSFFSSYLILFVYNNTLLSLLFYLFFNTLITDTLVNLGNRYLFRVVFVYVLYLYGITDFYLCYVLIILTIILFVFNINMGDIRAFLLHYYITYNIIGVGAVFDLIFMLLLLNLLVNNKNKIPAIPIILFFTILRVLYQW